MDRFKTIALFVLLILTSISIWIYISDWNLANEELIPWLIGSLAVAMLLFLGTLPNKLWQKITLIIVLSGIVGFLGFSSLFFSFFKCEDRILTTWQIEKYVVSYGYSECWAGPAEKPKYVLEEISFGGMLKKKIDIVWKSETKNLISNKTFLANKNCFIAFKNGTQFDLCSECILNP